ncbi:MAG: EAL domain-containing protein [Alcanivoracaceae bacterium]
MATDRSDPKQAHAWKTLLADPTAGFALCDSTGTLLQGNDAFCSLLELKSGSAAGHSLISIAWPQSRPEVHEHLLVAAKGGTRAFIFNGSNPFNARPFSMMLVLMPFGTSAGIEQIACLGFPLRQPDQDSDLYPLLDSLGKAAVILDEHGDARWTNRVCRKMTGHQVREPDPVTTPFLTNTKDLINDAMAAVSREGMWLGEITATHAEGHTLDLMASITPLSSTLMRGRRWLLLFSDITSHQNHVRHLEHLVRYDSLTGLLSHNTFRNQISDAISICRHQGNKLAVHFMDLDNFKNVNDSYGHKAGDDLLREVGQQLREEVEASEGTVRMARLGGDEFSALIMPCNSPDEKAETFCRNIVRRFRKPIESGSFKHTLSFSIGGVVGPNPDETANEILHRADQEMYRIKRREGKLFSILSSSFQGATSRAMRETELAYAVRRNQIEAYFQLAANLKNGHFCAIEARVRWSNGGHTQLTASDIFRSAHQTGEHWVVDQAVLQYAISEFSRLNSKCFSDLYLAINLTTETASINENSENLLNFLSKNEYYRKRLRIEIPIEAILQYPDTTKALIYHLTKWGVQVIVDHVDSADLQISALKDVPVKAIKLHENLVKSAPEDVASTQRIWLICKAARELGIPVFAEGVVRIEQLDFLLQSGCQEAQGPLISPPRSLGNLMPLLERGRCW